MAAFLVIGLALCLMPTPSSASFVFVFGAETQKSAQPRRRAAANRPQKKAANRYANFSHTTHVTKQKLTCDSCHKVPTSNWKDVRKGDDAFADVVEFPEHSSCLSCHRQQFFARERPAPVICSNCHVAVTPRDTARWPFPSLGEPFFTTVRAQNFVLEFHVAFPHPKHTDIECGDCHATYQPQGKSDDEYVTKPPKTIGDAFWLKKGTFKTRPLTHATCFTCHNQESELAPLPKNCDGCHKPLPETRRPDFDQKLAETIGVNDWWSLTAWRNRISAGAFRHELHEGLEVKCTQCHQATIANLANAKLSVPVKSCGGAEGCHVTATADEGGALNYELEEKKKNPSFVCTKCHLQYGKEAVPANHVNALPKGK